MSTQCMFATALGHERDLGLNFWEAEAPRIEGLGVSVAAPDGTRPIDWVGRLDGYAQSVDQRVKMAGWLETFAERGGQLVVHGAAVSDLDYFARRYDLVLVAGGQGRTGRHVRPRRGPFPLRRPAARAGRLLRARPRPAPEHPDFHAVRCNLVPTVGELFVMPTLTTSGPCDILFWEGVPGGPLDVFDGVKDPAEHLRLTLELMEQFTALGVRAGPRRRTHRRRRHAGRPATPRSCATRSAELPSGGLVLGVADVVVANDPITGQGSNNAAKCAASYLRHPGPRRRAVRRGLDAGHLRPLLGLRRSHVTKWTNAMLAPPPEHVLGLIGAAGRSSRSPTGSPTPSTTPPTSRSGSSTRSAPGSTWRLGGLTPTGSPGPGPAPRECRAARRVQGRGGRPPLRARSGRAGPPPGQAGPGGQRAVGVVVVTPHLGAAARRRRQPVDQHGGGRAGRGRHRHAVVLRRLARGPHQHRHHPSVQRSAHEPRLLATHAPSMAPAGGGRGAAGGGRPAGGPRPPRWPGRRRRRR